MAIIKIFYDLETTGTNVKLHSIHQISGIIEVDGVSVETFDFNVQPHPKCQYEAAAMRIGKVSEEVCKAYPPMKVVYRQLMKIIGKYVDKFDKNTRAWLVGYNNRSFDDPFFKAWLEQNGDEFFNAYFYADSLDVLVLASQYLLERRKQMPSFKLKRVAKEVGLIVDENKLHNSLYDVEITREVYRIVTGVIEEI